MCFHHENVHWPTTSPTPVLSPRRHQGRYFKLITTLTGPWPLLEYQQNFEWYETVTYPTPVPINANGTQLPSFHACVKKNSSRRPSLFPLPLPHPRSPSYMMPRLFSQIIYTKRKVCFTKGDVYYKRTKKTCWQCDFCSVLPNIWVEGGGGWLLSCYIKADQISLGHLSPTGQRFFPNLTVLVEHFTTAGNITANTSIVAL